MSAAPDSGAPDPKPSPPPAGKGPIVLLVLSTALALLLVQGWFRLLAGGAALLGVMALLRARRRSQTEGPRPPA